MTEDFITDHLGRKYRLLHPRGVEYSKKTQNDFYTIRNINDRTNGRFSKELENLSDLCLLVGGSTMLITKAGNLVKGFNQFSQEELIKAAKFFEGSKPEKK